MTEKTAKKLARVALGSALIFAGVSHLTFARKGFQAQVPDFVPLDKDDTVVYSGIVEMLLGGSLVFANEKQEKTVGQIVAGFFTAIFPGNIEQYTKHRSSLGLDTDRKRFVRLFFQPALVYWALKSTNNL